MPFLERRLRGFGPGFMRISPVENRRSPDFRKFLLLNSGTVFTKDIEMTSLKLDIWGYDQVYNEDITIYHQEYGNMIHNQWLGVIYRKPMVSYSQWGVPMAWCSLDPILGNWKIPLGDIMGSTRGLYMYLYVYILCIYIYTHIIYIYIYIHTYIS